MRIVQVVNHFYPCTGGKESIVRDLALNLRMKSHAVEVVCLDKCAGSGGKLKPKEEWNGIKISRIKFLNLHFLKIGFPPVSILRKADVVHAHGLCFLTDFVALAKPFYRKPLVLSTHGGVFHTRTISVLKKIYFYLWLRLIGRAFDKVIAVSNNDFELFSKIFPPEKMALAENAIDTGRFKGIARKPLENSFLFVGRLSRNKRVDLLIEAFTIFSKKRPNSLLTIVGEDFDGIMPELKSKANALGTEGKIVFEGKVSDEMLLELFSKHVFFVSASNYEGFGVSAIEGMAAGLIPLLNNIPSFQGFIEEGKNGFILDFGNSELAAKKIESVCSLGKAKLDKIGLEARKFAERFSWEKRVKEFEKVYESIAASH